MKISGFTMAKNADKLYYPIKESIESILPIVDEFIVAIGDNDADDQSLDRIRSIASEKIKIIRTVWDITRYPNGTENAHQTDLAKEACTGDWLFYLQADEVIHEKYLGTIEKRCRELLDREEVEGLLFRYKHFWGDYNHILLAHGWYPNEIRIIRNHKDIHSWESAQSFRRIPHFDYIHYRQQKNTYKLKVARVDAEVYHYGWVRPPELMQRKKKSLDTIHHGVANTEARYKNQRDYFDYGPMKRLHPFTDTHPQVMNAWIQKFNWADQLNYTSTSLPDRELFKHEKLKYRVISWIEQHILSGNEIGGFKNYRLLKV
ncbi:hypothetical protein LBMAG25_09390 [Bacteroidota bacterium]|nr:hypothetical protein LBMAG25_09390 [Bacteroidota bacterium]